MGLLRRSDALGNALDALERSESAYPDTKAEYVGVVREDFGRAAEAFSRYRAELGLPDRPGSRNARKPA